ncbi:L-threonylcarbamoyladenylate synthase [Saccharicrinis sp. FJH62]|uniref:L-threonylcarbamoyladenylate synthase n=1 Tax=Saccharicrinis sp. FJH62 TaxID=3344657 RepID=UPI0035D400F9
MLIKLYEKDTNQKQVEEVVEILRNNGVIIVPTDTIYAFCCSLNNPKGIDKIHQLKRNKSYNLSLLCSDLSQLSQFTKPISNPVFKLMRNNLPGPFTFILEANNNVPKLFRSKKKSIGIRVPDNNIIKEITSLLGVPLVATSIHSDDVVQEYITDPELIHEKFENLVNLVIDGGYGNNTPSTVIDCTLPEPEVIREGAGEIV